MPKFTSETAVEAGKKSRIKQYDKNCLRLGKTITGPQSNHIRKYMDELWANGESDKAFDYYLKLLQYFKPKVMAHAVKTQTEVVFRFESTDKELFEDV